ncbi:MAG: hypothetical protein M1838_003890 [Thelocarpon superellum]|nr:MAG: hypothetical protein M1838_003890 [Thelocarpon superellum]
MALGILQVVLTLFPLAGLLHAHGNHDQVPLSDDVDWALRHLAEEHHISNFDPGAFFALHDFDESGIWTPDEILRTYGLEDESMQRVGQPKRDEIVAEIMQLMDTDGDGKVDMGEWMAFCEKGGKLPDFGFGAGHHGDDEYEYEIHHFEKEEDLTHPEDIAHFKKHDMEADAEERQEKLDAMPIVEHNIPQKFRRVS